MKKLFVFLMFLMLGFSGCGKEEDGLKIKSIDFVVRVGDWQDDAVDIDENLLYYYKFFQVPELTQKIFNSGLFKCYYIYENNEGFVVQTPLPFSFYNLEVIEDNGEVFFYTWSVSYSYDVSPGDIVFRIAFSDFFTDRSQLPSSCAFRLVLIY